MNYRDMDNLVYEVFNDHPEMDLQSHDDLTQIMVEILADIAKTDAKMTVSDLLKLLNEAQA